MKRKLTFVLGLLIASLTGSVFAQSFDEQKTYSICNRNDANIFMQDNGTGKVDLGAFNDNSYWKLIATTNDNCYYVQNAVTQKYMQSTAGNEVEVNTGDTPVEISIILCTKEGEGMYGMASTDQTTYDFTSGTIGANWRNDGVVQGFAAVSGTNHRSFWKIEERAIPEPVTLTSPYAGSVAAEGTFFLYNVKTGKWMGDNHIKTGGDWTSHGELGPRGRDIDLKAGNAEGCFQLDPKLGHNHSINGSNLYMDTDDGVTNWIFTPVTVEGLTNCYSLTTPGGKAMGANADGWATSDAAAIAENGNIWQLVSREQRLEAMKEGDDCSWLVLGGTFPVADSHRDDNAYKTWYGEYGNNNCGGDGLYHCNQVWEFWNISQRDIYQDIAVPNGKYKFKAQAIYVSTGGNNMNADRYNEYVADPAGNTKGMVYANDVTTPMINVYSLVTDERVNDRNTKELGNGKWAYNGTIEFSTNIFEGKGWTNEIEVTVTNGTLRVGAKVEGAEAAWMLIDNFTLTYAGELDAADLTPYIEALSTAIGKAEAFNGNTTNALNTAITNALTDARAALNSEDGEEMANKATALTNAVAAAEAVDVTILQQTIAVAEQGVDLTEANDFITNGTSADVLNDILFKLRTARKINALGVADTFTGSTPTADTEYFLYNIGTGMWLANGSDWNTHAAVDIYPLGVKLIAADGGRFKMQTHMFKNREEKWINYNAYVDTNGQDTWTFNAVEGKDNVYSINSEGDRTDVGRLLGYDPFGPTDKGSYRYWSNVAKDREGVNNPNNQWKLVTRAEIEAKMEKATQDNPVEVSYLIDNGGLNRVWTLDNWAHEGGAHMSSEDDGDFNRNSDYAYEYYNTNSFSFTQELSNLVPGKYEVRVNGFFRQGNGDYQANIVNNNGELISEVYLKANSEKTFLPNIATEAGKLPGIASKETNEKGAFVNWGKEVIPAFETGLYQASVTAIVGEDGKLTIGVAQDQKTTDDSWTMFDSFRLFYLGNSIDLSELITSLSNAISEAESFDINTTSTALATTLTQALNDAKSKLTSEVADEITNATNALNTALTNAKAVNIIVLKKTAELAEAEGINVDAARTAIAEATTSAPVDNALNSLRIARRVNAADIHENVFKGNQPAEGDFYLYNVGAKRFLCGGDDWGAHCVVGFPGQLLTFTGTDGNYRIDTHLSNGGNSHYLGYNGYMDTDATTTWTLVSTGKDGVYVLARTESQDDLLGYDTTTYNIVHSDRHDSSLPENQWILVSVAERDALIELASEENPVDLSYKIQAPGFDQRASIDKWAMTDFSIWGRGGNHPDFACESWNKESNKLSQTIEGLPSGNYKVSVQGFFRDGNLANQVELITTSNEPAQLASLYAGEQSILLPNIVAEKDKVPGIGVATAIGELPDNCDQACNFFQLGLYKVELDVVVGNDGKLEIGVSKNSKNFDEDWVVVDNFRLVYFGNPAKAALEAAKDSLAALIATAKAIDTTGKTSESATALSNAITNAETALAAENATVESLNAAKTTLQNAIDGLKDEVVDGINVIEAAAKAGKVYNTQGQKVNKTQKGVYIINGKKTVVK
ncbi:MAG: FIVAR domain-containing protein [Prevotella sp.]|nr:FIVAR domain-containing protein [Prevotella sp.]